MTTICSLAVIAASLLVVQFISFSTAGVCDQPKDPGPCEVYIPRYYYDQEAKTCKFFVYGGCQGNGNNFHTKEECDRTCNPVCDQPPDTGPCKVHIDRYYYDQEAKTCKIFVYGGCQGNVNNFHTKEECDRTCNPVLVCDQPPDTGPCKAGIRRYYYDQGAKTCKIFFYGGCLGNGNNFHTKEECNRTCNPVCDQPPDTGPCKVHIDRYYYDQEAKTCKIFVYGGCQGNVNNFHTKEECDHTCNPVLVCDQPPDTGPCKMHIDRYYYDQEAKTCKIFVYGGCPGNKNNFLTKEECERTCNPVCDQPPDIGPCEVYVPSYYYDQKAKTCKFFVYGGCQGNGNNFHTKEECNRTCNPVK